MAEIAAACHIVGMFSGKARQQRILWERLVAKACAQCIEQVMQLKRKRGRYPIVDFVQVFIGKIFV